MESTSVTRQACARVPTPFGTFQVCVYAAPNDDKEHLALVYGEVNNQPNVLARVHSECFTGDVLGSLRCDCGEQLQRAMQMIAEAGAGVIVYLRQEGRGIGLSEKLRAYNLQDEGYDTVDANLALGHQADARKYDLAAEILRELGIQSVRLLTNNPAKVTQLQNLGIQVNQRVPVEVTVNPENARYLETKARRMNHLLNLG
ncbi:MAG: hypothetical protein OHK0052_24990 [Anaerolineales bacterium]